MIPGAISIFELMFQSLLKNDFHNRSSLETRYQVWETEESFSMSLKSTERLNFTRKAIEMKQHYFCFEKSKYLQQNVIGQFIPTILCVHFSLNLDVL